MKLKRFEFGLASADQNAVEVYARRSDGARFTKSFPPREDILEMAELDFDSNPRTWARAEAPPESRGLSEVWTGQGTLYVSGESAITCHALEEREINTILSVSKLKPDTRNEILSYLSRNPRARHVEAPIRDVLPRHQDASSALNAEIALRTATSSLQEGEHLLVHCLMGIHRSVAIAAATLVLAGHFATPRDAFIHIQARRRVAGWAPDSVEWLLSIVSPIGAPT